MTLTQLQYALHLAQYGSFIKASEKLHISQPALSIQIHKLEEEIDLVLFDRSKNPISPTSDGFLFLERARKLIVDSNNLLSFSERLNQEFKGSLRIGIIPTLAPFLVPLFAEPLQKGLPQLKLDISENLTERVVKDVLEGKMDVGIISTPFEVYGINSIPLFYEKFFIYSTEALLSHKLAVNLREIPYDKLWLLEEGNCFRDQINNFCDLNKIRKDKAFIYRSNSIDALIRIVDTKGGMTIVPELATLSLSEKQEEYLKTIDGIPKAREIGLITTKNPGKGRFIEKLQEYIVDNIPKSMLTVEGIEVVSPEVKLNRL
jgi:LysR family hydrogen peroxide-inducible transcriptional activator